MKKAVTAEYSFYLPCPLCGQKMSAGKNYMDVVFPCPNCGKNVKLASPPLIIFSRRNVRKVFRFIADFLKHHKITACMLGLLLIWLISIPVQIHIMTSRFYRNLSLCMPEDSATGWRCPLLPERAYHLTFDSAEQAAKRSGKKILVSREYLWSGIYKNSKTRRLIGENFEYFAIPARYEKLALPPEQKQYYRMLAEEFDMSGDLLQIRDSLGELLLALPAEHNRRWSNEKISRLLEDAAKGKNIPLDSRNRVSGEYGMEDNIEVIP